MSEEFADTVAMDTPAPDVEEVLYDHPETEVEAIESDEDQDPDEADISEDSDEDQPEGESADIVRVEYDGEEFDVPTKLKDALMRTQDYTQKTQSLAEERRKYEAEVAEFGQYQEASKAQSQHLAQLSSVDMELAKYNVDWNAFYDADFEAATKADRAYRQLQDQRAQLVGTIQQSEQQRLSQRNAQIQRTAEATDKALTKELPNWNKETKTAIAQFATDVLGIPRELLAQAAAKHEMQALYYAKIGYDAMNKVSSKPKPKPQEFKPVARIQPKRQSAPKNLSNVRDPEEYRNLRLAQQQKSRK
jgi:hypothetical protein